MAIESDIFGNKSNEKPEKETPRRARGPVLWQAATAIALAAVVILFVNIHQLGSSMREQKEAAAAQIAKLSDLVAQQNDASNQRLEAIAREAHDTATSAEAQAKIDVRRANASLAARIAKQTEAQQQAEQQAQQQVAGQLTELKQAADTTNSKLEQITGDVTGVRGDMQSAQSLLDQHGTELKRMTGDMGVMSGLIATNGKQLAELKELGDRNYVEFDLKRNTPMQKLGNIQLQLAKADPKRNRFTLEVVADDKRVEKRDRTINEPVQLYVSGNRQPDEIVVNDVKKDEVKGYLALPKVTMARR